VIGSVLINKNTHRFNIESLDRQYLQQKLANLPKEKLNTILQEASTQVCKDFNISDRLLQKHIAATVMDLSVKLINALENNRLESIFISLKEKPAQPVFQFDDGEKMNDDLFRSLAGEIRECRFVSDKIAIIQKEIHSITDLVDLLEGGCIFGSEFAEVFQSLGDMELALLLKRVPTNMTDLDLHFTENEKEWQSKLICFFNEMDLTTREKIREVAGKIDLD
jgi:hypothetical protein